MLITYLENCNSYNIFSIQQFSTHSRQYSMLSTNINTTFQSSRQNIYYNLPITQFTCVEIKSVLTVLQANPYLSRSWRNCGPLSFMESQSRKNRFESGSNPSKNRGVLLSFSRLLCMCFCVVCVFFLIQQVPR